MTIGLRSELLLCPGHLDLPLFVECCLSGQRVNTCLFGINERILGTSKPRFRGRNYSVKFVLRLFYALFLLRRQLRSLRFKVCFQLCSCLFEVRLRLLFQIVFNTS